MSLLVELSNEASRALASPALPPLRSAWPSASFDQSGKLASFELDDVGAAANASRAAVSACDHFLRSINVHAKPSLP